MTNIVLALGTIGTIALIGIFLIMFSNYRWKWKDRRAAEEWRKNDDVRQEKFFADIAKGAEEGKKEDELVKRIKSELSPNPEKVGT